MQRWRMLIAATTKWHLLEVSLLLEGNQRQSHISTVWDWAPSSIIWERIDWEPLWTIMRSAWLCSCCHWDQHNHIGWLVKNAGWRILQIAFIFQSSSTTERVNGKIRCFGREDLTGFAWHNPHTQLCSSHECMFLSKVSPFQSCFAKKLCWHKDTTKQRRHFFTCAKFAKFILCPRHIKNWSKHALPDLRPWIFHPLHTL